MGTNPIVSQNGSMILHGKGIESVRRHVERAGEYARSLGPTAIRKIGETYLRQIEGQHLGEGLEIIEEIAKKSDVPMILLGEQARVKDLLTKLEDVPMSRRRLTNVWKIEVPTDKAEKIFRDALVSLGHEDPADSLKCNLASREEPRKKGWLKDFFG